MLKKNNISILKVVKLPKFLICPHVPSSEFLLSISSCSWRFPGRACNCSLPAADHTFQTKMNEALSSSYLFPDLLGLSVLLDWCQIVLVPNCPVPNCLFLLCWCQIVRVPNCPVPNCPGAKLSWCQIVQCQIVRCQIVLPPFRLGSD